MQSYFSEIIFKTSMADAESAGTGEQKIGRSTARSMSLHGLMVALIAVAAVITHMKFGSKHCKNSCFCAFPPPAFDIRLIDR